MAASDYKALPKRGVALRVKLRFFDSTTGLPWSGALADLAAQVSKDDGAFAASTNTPVQVDTDTSYVYLDLTSTEATAYAADIDCTSSTANAYCDGLSIVFSQNPDFEVNVVAVGGSNITAAGGILAVNSVQISGDATAADNAEAFFDGTGYNGANNTMPTVTTLTNDPAGVTSLLSRLTTSRAGYLDNLSAGAVALESSVAAIQNNTRNSTTVPEIIERPDSGTTTYRIELFLYDSTGNMEAPDSAPTIALVNQAGTDRSSRLDSTTMANVSTGRYRAIYTADAGDALEQLVWVFSVTEGGATRQIGRTSIVVDTTAVDFSSTDRTKLTAIYDKLPSKTYITGTSNSDGDVQMDEATGNFPGSVASVVTKTGYALASTGLDLVTSWTVSITGSLSGNVGGVAANGIAASSLAADAGQELADALLDRTSGIESNMTLRQGLRLVLAALAGKLSGAGGTTITIRDVNDTANRIVATVDATGNRSNITLNP